MTTELISFLSKCFNTAVVNVIYFLFCKNVYGAKDYKKIVFVLACIASTCLTILVNRANNPYMNIICTYAALNVTSVLLFNAKFKTAWLYNTLLWFLSAFCDTITVIAWSAVRGETLDKILGDYQLMLCSNLTNMLLLIAMYMVYTTILKKVELYDVQWKLASFMALLAFFEVLVIIFFASEINTKQGGLKIIFISVGLIATNIFLSYIIAQVSKVYKYKYELSLAERLKEIQLENYKQINEKYQQSRIIIHDIKKHLMVIDNLKNKDSEEYSNNIYKRLDELFCGFHCSCEILSIVMSQKIAVAKAEGINVVTKMTDNYEIKPNQTVYFGYIASGENMTDPQSFEVCSKEIIKADGYSVKTNILSQWTNGFVAEVIVANATDIPIRAWKLDFETECQITNVWNASVVNLSENKYTIACATETFEIPANGQIVFGMQGVCGATPEFNNYVLHEVVTDGSEYVDEEIDYELDTDSDGLPDYYEEIIGSDPKTEHSDDDQLPDEYEALYLGTDPSKSDSDDNGTSDADEDFDTDGLTNLEEYNLGTDPFLEDSDYDTLSDKDEVNIHSTNPTKSDTDDDLVPDGDEVKLGLDPNSGSTNGTPDSERTFSQVVTAESEVLAAVNDDEETPFDVSLEITAAGVAESNVYARESGYSNAIENPSIIGIAPEFVYTDGLEVEEVTVKFELDNTIINNTLGTYTAESDEFKGIKRLNVFMFFEDVNMLLPVETFHDEATNTVYTITDRMGTYCLVDMELWLDNLGIVPEITEPVEVYSDGEVSVYTDYAEETEVYASGQKYKDNFDVAFLIDARMETNDNYANSRRSILEMCDIILTVSPNARIRFIQLLPIETSDGSCYNVLTHGRDNVYFTDYDAICEALSNFEPTAYDNCYVTPGLEYVINTASRETFCFYILEKDGSIFNQISDDIPNKVISNITVSVVSDYKDEDKNDDNNLKLIPDICKKTGGQILYVGDEKDYEENITGTYNFKNRGLRVIYGCVPTIENSYKAIIATGYKTVELNSSLQQNYEWYLNSAHYDVFRDTDIDGLCDYEEIRFATHNGRSLIDDSDPNNVKLFTYAQIVDILDDAYSYFDENEKHFYVQDGLKRYMDISGEEGEYPISLLNTYILPINSDPTHEDGDRDGFKDKYERTNNMTELLHDIAVIEDYIIDDTNCIDEGYSVPTSTSSIYCDAVVKSSIIDEEDPNKYVRAYLSFTRSNTADSVFILEPEENSDYIFENSENYFISVKKMYGLGVEEFIDPIEENTYALEKGCKYKIAIISDKHSDGEYTFEVRQDNWVYAPDGGMFESTIMAQNIGIGFENNIPLVRTIFFNSETTNIDNIYNEQFLKDLDKEDIISYLTYAGVASIPYDKIIKKLIDKKIINYAASEIIPIIQDILIIKVIYDCAKIAGDYCLSEEYKKAKKINNGNIYYIEDHSFSGMGRSYTYAHWYSWSNAPYINKYQGVACLRGEIIKQYNEENTYWLFD